ncbi:hypothetical protein QTO34_017457 [Cnephaeus nilssonii]|uniref:Tetraspanin n=1 Tax=Cnephaeus nilssonii TaxID=3371016 RepID=A0AA40LP44_CNENI|nr:hypothetical protein QTO34_017457 [Eptesicus nilssonii]
MAVEGGMKCVKILHYVFLLAFFVSLCSGTDGCGYRGPAGLQSDRQPGGRQLRAACGHHCSGAFLFLVAIVGCCGACQESYCLMVTFVIFLSLIVLVEVATAIAGYVLRGKVMSEFNKDFREHMKNYPKQNQTDFFLDRMQKEFKCCGAANYTDWETVPLEPKNRVPDSCCVNVTEGCGVNFKVKDIHTEGCVEKIGVWLRSNVLVVAAAALGIAFVEVLGIIFACCLVKSIQSGYEVM